MGDNALQQGQTSVTLLPYDMPQYRQGTGSGIGSEFAYEQAHINCFMETWKNQITNEQSLFVHKRPGLIVNSNLSNIGTVIAGMGTPDDMTCLANVTVTGLYDVNVAAFFDSNNSSIYIIQYRPDANTAVKIGTITSANLNDMLFITEGITSDSLTPMIAISYQKSDRSSGTGYYALSTAGVFTATSLTPIASPSFPSNLGPPQIITGPFQYLNGHFYIGTINAVIYMSSLTSAQNPDITTWNANGTVVASQYPDRMVGVYRYKALLLAFGQDSVEFFQDAANPPPGSSLERTDQAFIKFGAQFPKQVVNIDDTIYWVAYGSSDVIGVWKLIGYTPQKISTAQEDTKILNAFANAGAYVSYATLESLSLWGKKHLIFNGPRTYTQPYANTFASSLDTFNITGISDCVGDSICYSIDDNTWWAYQAGVGSNSYLVPSGAQYPTSTTAGAYRQYCFRRSQGSTGLSSMSGTFPMFFDNSGATFTDANPATTPTTNPYTSICQLNTYHFGTEDKKRINKIKALIDPITVSGGDSNTYAVYIYANRSNADASQLVVRRVPVTTSYRYFANQFGMTRAMSIGVMCKAPYNFRLRGFEINLDQTLN